MSLLSTPLPNGRSMPLSSGENTEKLSPREQGDCYGRQKEAFHHLRGWSRTLSYYQFLPHEFSQPQIRKQQMESISFTVKFILKFDEGKHNWESHAFVIIKGNKATLMHSESKVLKKINLKKIWIFCITTVLKDFNNVFNKASNLPDQIGSVLESEKIWGP